MQLDLPAEMYDGSRLAGYCQDFRVDLVEPPRVAKVDLEEEDKKKRVFERALTSKQEDGSCLQELRVHFEP